ncbi:hypothetical protein [Niabella drilacis]|uniref:Uncharacterized protein n=1 Tax=Niabella drilacis (strain DSM 25811 / CCM 8410 / CCUG 62505 / LMG 26954 / E90) TaxID=1285928 RepID=A0A1G7B2I4_NIADE|nr:hypothetical protein [Niabella drilacis]SDE20455.1 hypothetical protein SAMN04487894_12625 [Niabella drilacis]
MKKLNFQNIDGALILTREQLKTVMGGSGNDSESGKPHCASPCTSGSDCSGGDNTCTKCTALLFDVPNVGKKGDKICQTT